MSAVTSIELSQMARIVLTLKKLTIIEIHVIILKIRLSRLFNLDLM